MKILLCETTFVVASAMSPVLATQASAQEMSASANDQADSVSESEQPTQATGTQEIVVTAQRRSESLQDVPIAITAVTAQTLESANIVSTEDLPVLTPGLTMTTSRNAVTPFLRGIGSQAGTAGVEGAVAVYVDGVYMPSAVSGIFSLNNIERVEVLKGPQGTLFGRNATGGLIHVITRDPEEAFMAKGAIGYGNYGTVEGNLYVTGGLAPGVSMDLALNGTYQGEGFGTNLLTGEEVGLRREGSARSKLKIEAGPATTILLSADYSLFRNTVGSVRQPIPGATGLGGFVRQGDFWDANSLHRFYPREDSWSWGLSGIVTHELSDNVELQSTTAFHKLRVYSFTDTDGTPLIGSDSEFVETGKSFQQEILLNGSTDRLSWTTGVFFLASSGGWDPLIIGANPPSPARAARFGSVDTKSYSAFAQGTYEILTDTNLTLGARYTYDEREVGGYWVAVEGNTQPVGTILFDSATVPESQKNRNWDAVTWRIALDHQFTPDVLAYASVNRGYKSGSFNPTDPSAPAVDPESLTAYEIGLKTDLADRTVRFNAAGFYYDYKNIQLQRATGAGSVSFNAPSGRVWGAELELGWSPRLSEGRLDVNAAVSLLDTEYKNFLDAPITVPIPTGGNSTVSGSANGNDMIRAPGFSSTFLVDYRRPIGKLEIGGNVTWQHMGRFYFEVDNRVSQDPYDLVNAQISLGAPDEKWTVALWAKNLFEAEYLVTMNSTRFGDGGVYAPPRTYGVRVGFQF